VFHILDMIKGPIKNLMAKKPPQQTPEAAAAAAAEARKVVRQLSVASSQHVDVTDEAISQYEYEDGAMIASRHRFAKVCGPLGLGWGVGGGGEVELKVGGGAEGEQLALGEKVKGGWAVEFTTDKDQDSASNVDVTDEAISQYEYEDGAMIASRHRFARVGGSRGVGGGDLGERSRVGEASSLRG
jgi:hypothetical protein